MDGTLAAIFLLGSLADMGMNHCGSGAGCLGPRDATARLSFQAAGVMFQDDEIGKEIYLGHDTDFARGPFQPTIGVSVTDEGSAWVGIGVKDRYEVGYGGFFVEGALMPGYYWAGDGPDLGGSLQFRTSLGAGYEFANGGSLSVQYDHRSNADIQMPNPGLETVGIRYSLALY